MGEKCRMECPSREDSLQQSGLCELEDFQGCIDNWDAIFRFLGFVKDLQNLDVPDVEIGLCNLSHGFQID